MPFSETVPARDANYWTSFFENFIKPAIEAQGFRVYRSEAKTGKITKDIVQELAYADLVFAVLTDNNPNVWYELGVRHASRLGTVLAIQRGQDPAFDVRDYGIIFYGEDDHADFGAKLQAHIASIPRRDSAVADFLKIDLNSAVNVAIATLRKGVAIVNRTFFPNDIAKTREALREYQQTLPPSAQISALCNRKFIFQRDVDLNSDPSLCWHDVVKPGTSFLDQMLQERNGLRIGQVKDCNNRMTVIAFETLRHSDCLVVAEGHYWQEGPRPY
jgi:hypothetical protein